MINARLWAGLALAALMAVPSPVQASDVEDRLEVLTEEIRRIRERLAIPDTDDELATFSGLGPAASKVYRVSSGISLGGYGEFYYSNPTGLDEALATGDYYRFISYFGYKFSPHVVMNTEIEIEHGTTSSNFAGSGGSVSVEFSYLDFLLSDEVNIRAGNLLVPLGITNEMHEPPFYRGNFRPTIERAIIPSTFRELGAGIHGTLAEGLSYKAYAVNGLNAMKYSSSGVRGGRQKGNRVLFEDIAIVLAAAYETAQGITVGGSLFTGGAGQGQDFAGEEIDARTTIAEGHVIVKHQGFEGRAMFVTSSIDDADKISDELSMDENGDIDEATRTVVPDGQAGFMIEGGYDVGPMVGLPSDQSLMPWVRFESWNLQDSVPGDFMVDPTKEASTVTVGLEYKPVPKVVIKADLTLESNEGTDDTEDPFRLGAGFVF